MAQIQTYATASLGWTGTANAVGTPDAVYASTASTGTLTLTVPVMVVPDDAVIDNVYAGMRWMTGVTATTLSVKSSIGDTATYNLPLLGTASSPADTEVALNPAAFTAAMLNSPSKTLSFLRVGTGTVSVDTAWIRVVYHQPAPAAAIQPKRWDGSAWVNATVRRWGSPVPVTNYSPNPSFEHPSTPLASWTQSGVGTSVATDATKASVGSKSMKALQSGGANSAVGLHSGFSFPENTKLTIAYDYLIPVGSPATSLRARLRDQAQALVFETQTTNSNPVKDGAWHRQVYRTQVAATFTCNQIYFDAIGATAAFDVNFDAVSVVPDWAWDGSYFDGDTPDTAQWVYDWTGAQYVSTSTRTAVPAWVPATVRRWNGSAWV